MAKEIQAAYTTGLTLYAIILTSHGVAWNTSTPGFEAFTGADWADYAVALTEVSGTGVYFANFPSGIILPDDYTVLVYVQSGGSPAETDTLAAGPGTVSWTGDRLGVSVPAAYALGIVTGSPTDSAFDGNTALSSTNGTYIGAFLVFVSGALPPEARQITGYTGSSRAFTFDTAFTAAPSVGDNFMIIGAVN